MKKTTFFKSLLVAAGLLVGTSGAWADTETVTVLSEDYESYAAGDITATMQANGWNFQSRNGKNQITIVQGTGDNKTKYFDFYYPDGGASRNQSWNFGKAASLNDDNWKLSFSADLNPGTNNSANMFYIVGTKSGKVTSANDAVTNALFKLAGTAAGAETYVPSIGETAYSQITLGKNSWYKFSVEASAITETTATIAVKITSFDGATTVFEQKVENMDITSIGTLQGLCWNSPRGWSRLSLDDVLLTKEVDASVCAAPTYTITGANGTQRKFTLDCETIGATIYYATSELAKGAAGWTEYTSEVSTDAATIYAYAVRGAVSSDIINFSTGAGSAITLNVPSVFVADFTSASQVVLNAYYNKAGVQFEPEATLAATFTNNAGVATNVTLPYTVTENGTLTVTASAEGFTSAEASMPVYGKYTQTWQSIDFSSLIGEDAVKAALGDEWKMLDGHGRWASWADGTYNFYQHGEGSAANITVDEKIRMREVVLLAEGRGLGRNVTGGEAINVISKANELVAFEIYNGYGNAINNENTFMSYAINNGTNPSMSSTNGALLVQATIYSPVQTMTIGGAGYSTYASAFALDLDNISGATAYYASAVADGKVTLSEATGTVPAGTGLILKGTAGAEVTIPAAQAGTKIDGNLLVGCLVDTDVAQDANSYVLVNNGGTAEFQSLVNMGATIPAGKAYLKAPAADGARLSIVFDTTTGISTVAAQSVENDAVYNLQGQRVVNAQKGLFIINGKKVVLK